MSAGFLKVLNISITSAWIVLVVVLLRFVLKKAPKWTRCVLWGLVALRLLLPITVESRFSLLPSAEPVQTVSVSAEPAADPQSSSAVRERVVLRSGFAAFDDAVNPVMEKTAMNTAKGGTDPAGSVETAAWIWIIGVGAMLVYAAVSFLHMKFKVRVSIETDKNVFVCDEVHSPFILGAIRPKIYLPSGLDPHTRSNVLAHERAHIRRMDHLWKPLGFLLLSVHWFNPLIWIAFILFSRDIEFACDEKVVSQYDAEGKAAYSDTLLAFSRQRKSVIACPVAFGEVGVKDRVKSILRYKKPATWVVLTMLIACAAVAVCFLTAPKPAKAAASTPASSTETLSSVPKLPLPARLTRESGAEPEIQGPDAEKSMIPPQLLINVRQQCDVDE